MNILVRRIDNPPVENFVEDLRTRFGCKTIDKKTSARLMFRLLQNGEIVGIVADLNAQEREGVFVDFFGTPASTTTGLAKLALRTDAAVIPAFAIWQKDKQKYLLKLEPPVEIEKTGNHEADVRALTQAATKVIEKYVRLYPEQWMWIHKRWNTRPVGENPLYK
jgi:KDO2-lipid IV(A) lauroyltransferase